MGYVRARFCFDFEVSSWPFKLPGENLLELMNNNNKWVHVQMNANVALKEEPSTLQDILSRFHTLLVLSEDTLTTLLLNQYSK